MKRWGNSMPYVVWPIKSPSNPREVQESECPVCLLLCEPLLLRYKSVASKGAVGGFILLVTSLVSLYDL